MLGAVLRFTLASGCLQHVAAAAHSVRSAAARDCAVAVAEVSQQRHAQALDTVVSSAKAPQQRQELGALVGGLPTARLLLRPGRWDEAVQAPPPPHPALNLPCKQGTAAALSGVLNSMPKIMSAVAHLAELQEQSRKDQPQKHPERMCTALRCSQG